MCTVVIRVPESAGEAVRMLAIRDEDPDRPWNALGPWWPERGDGIVGVRDVRAGGAWLAADPVKRRLAVLLNRADVTRWPESELVSRGGLVLDAVTGRLPDDEPRTHGFSLVSIDADGARVHAWDGDRLVRTELAPGTHMIAHDDVDDAGTARIAAWLPEFRAADLPAGSDWFGPWVDVLGRSAEVPATDDRAIIRDNRPHGYPTQSLLGCVASIGPEGLDVRYGELRHPAEWTPDLFG